VPFGKNGDCFDRYLIRIQEMRESLKIISQCLQIMNGGDVKSKLNKYCRGNKEDMKKNMETVIDHFK
jgi:NADH:ubiquinone oxidoreductase subunit D